MAAKSNPGFRPVGSRGAALDPLSSASHMIPFGSCFGFGTSSMADSMFAANSSFIGSSTGVVQVRGSSGSTCSALLDSVSDLKHDAGLAVEWSVEERCKLEEGLAKYSDEPRILSYIKIAAMLPDKTVRDVALRCRWITSSKMSRRVFRKNFSSLRLENLSSSPVEIFLAAPRTEKYRVYKMSPVLDDYPFSQRKRRKNEEDNTGRRVNNRKDRNDSHSFYGKHVETSSKMNWHIQQAEMFAAPPLSGNYLDKRHASPFEGISGPVRHRLEQNFEAFSHITANLSSFKVQDNIDLFGQTRNNIEAILDDLKEMPGIMNLMPPLPVCIDEDLVRCLFPNTIQSMMHGSETGIRLKQEPRG